MPAPKSPPEFPVKLFKHGGSQAARLPKELRIDGLEAIGYREGETIVLRPAPRSAWPRDWWASFGPVGEDFTLPEPLPPSPHRDVALEDL